MQLWARKCYGKPATRCPEKDKRICMKGNIPVSLPLDVVIWGGDAGAHANKVWQWGEQLAHWEWQCGKMESGSLLTLLRCCMNQLLYLIYNRSVYCLSHFLIGFFVICIPKCHNLLKWRTALLMVMHRRDRDSSLPEILMLESNRNLPLYAGILLELIKRWIGCQPFLKLIKWEHLKLADKNL